MYGASLSFFDCLLADLLAAGAGTCCKDVLCFLFADCGQALCLACSLLALLLVALSLPFGQPSLGVSLEAFNHFLNVLGESDALLLFDAFFGGILLLLYDLILIFLLLDRNMYVLLDELKISDIA